METKKQVMLEQLKRSPDRVDALCLTSAPTSLSNFEIYWGKFDINPPAVGAF
jgi:hypothetical protein